MNVIRQPKRGGGNPGGFRPLLMTNPKPTGRGRGALDFDPIQFRPGHRGSSNFRNGTMRTPSNLQLQMAITSSSSAHRRVSSLSSRTDSGNVSTPSSHSFVHPMFRQKAFARQTSSSSSVVTPRTSVMMGPPKTPRHNLFTPRNAMIVSSTPRTTPTSGSTGDVNHSHVVLAVSEGRGHARGEVGIAAIDIKRPRLILCQLSDRQTYSNTLTKISVFQPVEILVPHTFVDANQPNKLYKLLEEKFPFVSMTKVQRRLFRDSDGLERVQHLCLPENSSCKLIFHEKFYALAAAAALLKYVEFVQNVIFAARSLKVEYQGAHHGTIIDVKTAKNLELLLNQQSNSATHTLMSVVDHCCTHGGSRLLRASLLHPPCSLPVITKRQDSVQELVENPEIAQKIREVFQQLPDVEQLLTLCMQTPSTIDGTASMETRVNYVLQLKTTLESLPHMVAALENVQSFLLCNAKKRFHDHRGDLMKKRILETLNEDVKAPKGGKTALFQKCFAVKSGINELMDVARKTYCELINDMHEHVLELESTHSLPLKMSYSVTRGYHIQISVQKNRPIKKADLPRQFAQVQQSRNTLACTTDTLILANERIKSVTTDILAMSNTLLTSILNDIREHIGYLYEMCESIAEVDLVLSLSQISRSHNYVRPKFGDKLCLKSSRHPILESITSCDLIANDIEADSWKNLSIITGPNMSGKSIYIRQVLLLQIMAQVGCYVPAEDATFRITDRIFSHLNFDDSMEDNASTLALEMKEMQLILSSITATSLVALDELCRGTSVEEGTTIAWSLCEELSQSTAFVFITTHFAELTRLSSLYPSFRNVHLETEEHEFSDKRCRLVYTHRLLPGINPVENYGVRLAENLDVPKPVLQMTSTFAAQIRSNSELNLTSTEGDETYTLALAFYKLEVLIGMDGLSVDHWKSVQLNLAEVIREAQQRQESATLSQKVVHHTVADNILPEGVPHQQHLCDYSSSENSLSPPAPTATKRKFQEEMFPENPFPNYDHGSPKSQDNHPSPAVAKASKPEIEERVCSENSMSDCAYGSSPKHYDNSATYEAQTPRSSSSQSCVSGNNFTFPSPTAHDARSSSSQSCVSGNNFTFPSPTAHDATFSGAPESPRSYTSFCSQNTWLAGNPDQSSRYTESQFSVNRKYNSFSDSGDSDSDESSASSYFLPDMSESQLMSSSALSKIHGEENVMNDNSFSEFLGDGTHKILDNSVQSKGKSSVDFFSQSTAIVSQTSFNPFSFVNERPTDADQSFQGLFKNIDATPKKTLSSFPSHFFRSAGRSELSIIDEPSAPNPKASKPTQLRRPNFDSDSDSYSSSSNRSQSLNESRVEMIDESCSANQSVLQQVPKGNLKSLQCLMDAYGSSDSD